MRHLFEPLTRRRESGLPAVQENPADASRRGFSFGAAKIDQSSARVIRTIAVFLRSRRKFGDQIVTYPALYQLKQWWPGATLHVIAQHPVQHYYDWLPWVDNFICAPDFFSGLRAVQRRADLAVNLHHSSERYGLLNLLAGAGVRLGFRNRRLLDFAWTHAWDKNIEEYIGLANLNLLGTYRPVQPEAAARRCIEEIARQATQQLAAPDIVFIPGGGDGAFKRWHIDKYVALADLLTDRLGPQARYTFVLGPSEAAEHQRLQALGRTDFRLVYCAQIPALAGLMLRARLVVANDCGPSHLAQAACVPYVGIFNAPNPEWFWARPYTDAVVPRGGVEDIQANTPEQVLASCLRILSAAAHTG